MNNHELWQAVLADIELQITPANFITWFRNTSIASQKEGDVVVVVPNGFTRAWLEERYNKAILKSLRNILPTIKGVRYNIQTKRDIHSLPTPTRRAVATKTFDQERIEQEPLDVVSIDKITNLNPRYTFDSFVVGSFNELAHAAAQAISKQPGSSSYNPLFIYGGVGLGKTHLLQAVGNALSKKGRVVRYVSSERFTNELITSLHNHRIAAFKEKYRKVDVLIVDDIQFFAGKEKSQEEFFYTFNTLYENNKQIILSADRPPKSIASLEERLCSRFEGGMIADLGYPEYETRVAILKRRCQEKNITPPEDMLGYIAEHVQKNVRELEGALNLVLASTKSFKKPVQKEDVKKILKHIISKPKKVITPKKVLRTIADFYEISEQDILSKNRRKEISHPRQVAMFIMRDSLKNSYPFIW